MNDIVLLLRRPFIIAFVLALATLGSLSVAAEDTAVARPSQLFSREIQIDHRYLNIPIKRGAPMQTVTILVDGTPILVDYMKLSAAVPDWWAFVDLEKWQGRTATVQVIGPDAGSGLLERLELGDTLKSQDELYGEALRPLIHFSSRRGWVNDPNGLVYYNGEYHLFFQHTPYSWAGEGNSHWGHATSRDLVHWKEHGDVISPVDPGGIWSGSAVVDWENTSGFGEGGRPPLVLFYTSARFGPVSSGGIAAPQFTQCIAYSTDGRKFTKYAVNPVVGSITGWNRDPKVIWHAATKQWVMALYSETPAGNGVLDAKGKPAMVYMVQLLSSPNLRDWTPTSTIAGGVGEDRFLHECPDLFELPLDTDPKVKKWVIWSASGEYVIGEFDGHRFVPETIKLSGSFGTTEIWGGTRNVLYAAQTFSDAPDGRRIQMGWGVASSPNMPFNQLHLLPCELKLMQTSEGPRLARTPVGELASLRDGPDQSKALERFSGEAIELRAEIAEGKGGTFQATMRGAKITYDTNSQELNVNGTRAAAPWVGGRQNIIVYVDRTVIEVFASDGLTYIATPYISEAGNRSVSVDSSAGAAKVRALQVYKLKSIWNADQR
jgi:fructan beta-fructosidase